MANIAALAEIYSKMQNNIQTETNDAIAALKPLEGKDKVQQSQIDQVEMIEQQQLMAAEQMFIQMVSNVTKSEQNTTAGIAQNMK
jgi:hypothetical protein